MSNVEVQQGATGAIQLPAEIDAEVDLSNEGGGCAQPDSHVNTPAAEPESERVAVPAESDGIEQDSAAVSDPVKQADTAAASDRSAPDYGMPVHPVCDMFPLGTEEELDRLAKDIESNGQIHPAVVHKGQLADGRSRILACRMAGVKPRFAEWREIYNGPRTLPQWIWSLNVVRRHMNEDQIAQSYVKMHLWQEREAAGQRKAEGQRQGGETAGKGRRRADSLPTKSSGSYTDAVAPVVSDTAPSDAPAVVLQRGQSGDTRARMAKEARVSEYKMQQAINVETADPELGSRVIANEVPLRQAEKRVAHTRPKRSAIKADKNGSGTKGAKADKPAAGSKAASAAKSGPETRRGKKPDSVSKFDMEPALMKAVHAVEEALDSIPDECRTAFLDEMMQMLEKLK